MSVDNINQWEKKKPTREKVIEIINKELADLKMDIQQNNNWTNNTLDNVPQTNKEKDTYEVTGGEETKGDKVEERIEVNPEILKEEMRKDLKDISMMSPEKIKEELESYGVKIAKKEENNIINLRLLLKSARNTIANEDKNSNIIDFHIGTFTQQEHSKYCAVLAQLDSMTDDEIKDMIEISDDKSSYHIIFPNGDSTVITEEQLNSWSVTVDWENKILDDLPKGDKDVRLITMAYVQIFWTYIVGNWERQYKVQNKFKKATEPKLMDNQHFENIQDYTKLSQYWINTISVQNNDELKRKGFEFKFRTKEEVSRIKDKGTLNEAIGKKWDIIKWDINKWAFITTLSNGKNICITASCVYISDWTQIPRGHAMSIRWYDEKTEELIVTESEYNNISELRIPKELFVFLETASTEWTPGVDKTPQPPTDELLEPPTE